MDGKRYLFVGNRGFVLDRMRALGLDVRHVFAMAGSHLERSLTAAGERFERVDDKARFLARLRKLPFDVLVSNGCGVILPADLLEADPARVFVNVHPSYLPDLRGADGVPGALLFGRRSGATCHRMDAGIDTGPIIAREPIDTDAGIDAELLYQLTFLAEPIVFQRALERGFRPLTSAELALDPAPTSPVYYTVDARDRILRFGEDDDATLLRRIRAFANPSQGARIVIGEAEIRAHDGEIVRNGFLDDHFRAWPRNAVVLKYETCILVKRADAFLKLKRVAGDTGAVRVGDVLR